MRYPAPTFMRRMLLVVWADGYVTTISQPPMPLVNKSLAGLYERANRPMDYLNLNDLCVMGIRVPLTSIGLLSINTVI
jgi:hypothetical protein